MTSAFDRRAFLRRAGLAGAGTVAMSGAKRPAAHADEALAPFLHGVASGDPLHDRVILWTRVTVADAAPVPVRWTVARDPDLADVVASGTVITDATRDHTVKVDAAGLAPATTYWYGFWARGHRSLTGRTRTAPAAGQAVDRLRLGVVSCSNLTGGYFNGYALVAKRNDLDAVLHLGDYVYEYGNGDDRYGPASLEGQRDHQPPHEMVTLADYRLRYATYRLDPDLRRLHQLYPWICVWDDHEITNDAWKDGAENHEPDDPDTPGEAGLDYATRRRHAQQAYREWLPIRTDDAARIYRSFRYGDLADLLMLDTRIEGRDQPTGGPLTPNLTDETLDDPDRELISEAQRTWLYGQLKGSAQRGATWRILGQQVMLMQWNAGGLPSGIAGQDAPGLLPVRDGGNAVNPDAWDGYTAERRRLYDHLEAGGIDNLVVLTGDIHSSWAADLPRDPYDPAVYDPVSGAGSLGVEFVTPSVTSDNLNEILAEQAGEDEPYPEGSSTPFEVGTMADNPHIKYVDLDRHGMMILTVTPEAAQADWVFTPTRTEPSDDEIAGPSWRVLAGTGHVVPADAAVDARPGPDRPGGDPPGGDPPATPAPGTAGPPTPVTGGGATAAGLAALGAAGVLKLRTRRP
jgi:alkaline phosphatase D